MRTIITVDCEYVHPRFAAAYLVHEGGEAYFVETNTAHAVPRLLQALRDQSLDPAVVRYVIVTHAHLDHSAGAHALMQACPNSVLLAHPKAARHLIDPSKLEASARKVYGDANFEKLYGKRLEGIPAERVRTMEDGEIVEFSGGELRFLHTRGHANHHFCVHDERLGGIFTGDSFGLAYPALQGRGLFIFPSTSPIEFDPAAAKASVDRIVSTGASKGFLTHYGEIADLQAASRQLHAFLDFSADLVVQARDDSRTGVELSGWCEERLREFFQEFAEGLGRPLSASAWELIEMDVRLNAGGIAYVAEKSRSTA